MNIYILEGNIDKAKEIGKKIQTNLKSPNLNKSENSNLRNNNDNQLDFLAEQITIK